ncbi:hypothetical protein E2C01_070875 [Portunus trituberculatus]|uniref:Uncharacterized protein n=1 Tax=Portunus trituberculatus TaxID=210409 RepID=A0A5B7HYI2_PORTR|nr:hypothetical protein [Portunus trituberculatus]
MHDDSKRGSVCTRVLVRGGLDE